MGDKKQLTLYRKIFEKYDLDKDGEIEDNELRDLIKDAGQEPTKQNIARKLTDILKKAKNFHEN